MTVKIPRAVSLQVRLIRVQCMKHDFQCTIYKELIRYIDKILLIAVYRKNNFRLCSSQALIIEIAVSLQFSFSILCL